MPVYSSGSRRPGRPSRAFRLAYFDARPRAGIQAVYTRYCNATWLGHFYGHEGYREELGRAVKGLLHLVSQSFRVLGKSHRLSQNAAALLHRALTVQLDWSLDDLDLSPDQERVVAAFLSTYQSFLKGGGMLMGPWDPRVD